MIIQDNSATKSGVKNPGADKERLSLFTIGYILAKGSQSFASVDAFRTKAAWDSARLAKDIAVLYSVEKAELANVEPTYYESRTLKILTKDNIKGLKVTHHLGYISHAALESYAGSEYTYIYEITSDGQIKGVIQEDGSVKGQLMSNFVVGPVIEPVLDGDPQSSIVEIVYDDPRALSKSGAIVTPDFDITKFKGIYPITLKVEGNPTATELKVRATYSNQNIPLTGLNLASFTDKILKADGSTQTPNSVSAGSGDDANLYTFVDSDLETGTIATNVVSQSLIVLETDEAIPFTVS